MSYNMVIGYAIYDYLTMEHFRFQRMTLTTKIYCSRLYNICIFIPVYSNGLTIIAYRMIYEETFVVQLLSSRCHFLATPHRKSFKETTKHLYNQNHQPPFLKLITFIF
jgi:hypothetical protein